MSSKRKSKASNVDEVLSKKNKTCELNALVRGHINKHGVLILNGSKNFEEIEARLQELDKVVEVFKKNMVNDMAEIFSCPVCKRSSEENISIRTLTCKHAICTDCCVDILLNASNNYSTDAKCPQCRTRIKDCKTLKFGKDPVTLHDINVKLHELTTPTERVEIEDSEYDSDSD